jgi:hypothetical protein
MSFNELRAWEAYYVVEPWGQLRDNMHAGLIAAAVSNPHRRKGASAITYQDFLLVAREEKFSDNRRKFFATLKSVAKRGDA